MNRYFISAASLLLGASASAGDAPPATTVAIGSLDKAGLPSTSHYILQSTVLEQLRSRAVQTQDATRAPFVYLARVGTTRREKDCIYRVLINFIPNTVLNSEDSQRPVLWSRDFTSEGVSCESVSSEMTRTLDRFAEAFAGDLSAGKIRMPQPAAAATQTPAPAP